MAIHFLTVFFDWNCYFNISCFGFFSLCDANVQIYRVLSAVAAANVGSDEICHHDGFADVIADMVGTNEFVDAGMLQYLSNTRAYT